MPNHPRIETAAYHNFVTSRTRNSELWFINNRKLEEEILGRLAVCCERYDARLYALAFEGSHLHHVADFPGLNRADFMRDLNSAVVRAVKRHVPTYSGGNLWARRYSQEFLPGDSAAMNQFLYTVLQPVRDGLVEKVSDYPGYNCLHDAAWGIPRTFTIVDWAKYEAALKRKKRVNIKDFKRKVTLTYARLPGYEHLSREEYAKTIFARVEAERLKIIAARLAEGKKGFLGRAALLATVPGSRAWSPKVSHRRQFRPRFISGSKELNDAGYAWYLEMYFWYRAASQRYRNGELEVEFPPGMYRPYLRSTLKPPAPAP